jgi:hypothetical protein
MAILPMFQGVLWRRGFSGEGAGANYHEEYDHTEFHAQVLYINKTIDTRQEDEMNKLQGAIHEKEAIDKPPKGALHKEAIREEEPEELTKEITEDTTNLNLELEDVTKEKSKAIIKTGRKIYRPKLISEYEEPDLGPDMLDGMEVIFEQFGKTLRKRVTPLGPRDDIIEFSADIDKHQKQIDHTIWWENCPEEWKPTILEVIREYWDVFASEGL